MAIDILAAFENKPKPLDFVFPGFLAGTVGTIVAPGATGKSYLTLEAAMGVACTVAGGDLLDVRPENTGRSVYIAAEDPESVVKQRLHAIGAHLNQEARESIAENVDIEPVLGSRLDLMRDDHRERVIRHCEGARIVILDTLSRVHSLDENSNGEMSKLFGVLEQIGAETGAAVLFLHHTSKAASFGEQTDHQHASRGASLLTDNARFAASLVKMTEREADKDHYDVEESMRSMFVRFSVTKNNYGSPIEDRWYRRHEGGVLRPAQLEKKHRPAGNNGNKGDGNDKHNGGAGHGFGE